MNKADCYANNKKIQKFDAQYLLDNYFRLIRLDCNGIDKILDVGCGDGEVTVDILFNMFPKRMQKLIGCDISENMIKYASEKYQINKRISFMTLDIATQTLPENMIGTFHHVFSFYCLHWVQNQTQAMKNMYKLLRPGGDMFIAFINNCPIFIIHKHMEKNVKWSKYVTDVKNYVSPYCNKKDPAKDLEDLLKETGFTVPLCTIVDRTNDFKSVEDLKNNIIPVNPYISKIPENDRDDYLNDIILITKNMKLIEQNNNINNNNSNNNNNNNNEEEEAFTIPYQLLVAFAIKPE